MGKAVYEQIDADIEGVYAAGYGVYSAVTTLDYTAITNGLAAMGNNKWMLDPSNPPFLIISPKEAAVLVQDSRFIQTDRYYNGVNPDSLEGEKGVYAGCRVLVTPLLASTGKAYIAFPPNFKWGPVAMLAWKRQMRVREQRYEEKELSIFAATARVTPVVIQSLGLMRFDISTTP
jgi:hypothetical protein